jgi:cellobiose phosphorylase
MAFAQLGDLERAWELFALLNPINHASTPSKCAVYKVEPYVVAADVYAVVPHVGRGGWTWYTGSAGWMYRLVTETLLGVKLEGDKLRIQPRIPKSWPSFKIHYRYRETVYHITIIQSPELPATQILTDGRPLAGETILLVDDRQDHNVEIRLSNKPSIPATRVPTRSDPPSKPPGVLVTNTERG